MYRKENTHVCASAWVWTGRRLGLWQRREERWISSVGLAGCREGWEVSTLDVRDNVDADCSRLGVNEWRHGRRGALGGASERQAGVQSAQVGSSAMRCAAINPNVRSTVLLDSILTWLDHASNSRTAVNWLVSRSRIRKQAGLAYPLPC